MYGYVNFPYDHGLLVKEELSEHGYVESQSDDDLGRYLYLFEIRERLVPARPYRVHLSREIRRNLQFSMLRPTMDEVIARMTSGQPLAPYLSTLANKLVTHDHLLVHWGVHHLHLEPLCTLDERGYVARADNLLFFRVNGADIHLIDILPHNSSPFAQDELVKIVDRNWPQLHQQMRGFTTRVLSPAQIKKLRKGNLNTAIKTDTRVVMPAFGATSAGRSLAGVLEADRIFADLRRLEGLVAENYERWFPRSSAWITNVRLVGVEKDGYNLVDGASGYNLQLERTS